MRKASSQIRALALISAFLPPLFHPDLGEAVDGASAVTWQCGLCADGHVPGAPLKC